MNKCTRCLFTDEIAKIHQDGVCEYCKLHDKLEAQANPDDLSGIMEKVGVQKGKYNCLIGISGGLDSSTLLYMAVKKWGLKPLVIHFDNHWNTEIAESNMNNLIQGLEIDSIVYRVNKKEYDELNDAFLYAGVPDADIPNDIAMTKLMYETAVKYGIKYILNGHDFREEGSTPAKWTYMDAKYIQSVYHNYSGKTLKNYPLFTFLDQIKYGFKGIKQIRPFHYIPTVERRWWENELKINIGWADYGGKHCENIYTEFVGAALLPSKFGIDKRTVYLSARVRSGLISRQEAEGLLSIKPVFDYTKLGDDVFKRITSLVGETKANHTREGFEKYSFKKWKLVIWMMAKLKVVPWTFYSKYAK